MFALPFRSHIKAPSNGSGDTVRRQLLSNQLWETAAFLAKACFLFLLTPQMIQAWGLHGYGKFALASSAVVLFGALDCGIRPWMRVALCRNLEAGNRQQYRLTFCRAVITFSAVGLSALGMIAFILLFRGGFVSFKWDDTGTIILVAGGMTFLLLLSGLFVEPLAAHGHLSDFKLALAAGSFVAIPIVYLFVRTGFGPAAAVISWVACLIISNFTLFFFSRLRSERLLSELSAISLSDILITLRSGFAYGAINFTWLAKTHGLTFVVSLVSGASAAGLFFILLRITEIIGTLCAVSGDSSIAMLSRTRDRVEQRAAFSESYCFTALLTFYCALFLVLLAPSGLRLWLGPMADVSTATMLGLALFGFTGAFNRIVTGAAMALRLVQPAMWWGFVEASLTLLAMAALVGHYGFGVAFAGAALGIIALFPVANAIARCLDAPKMAVWLEPWQRIMANNLALLVVVVAAIWTTKIIVLVAAATIVLISGAWRLLGPHRRSDVKATERSDKKENLAVSPLPQTSL